MSTSRHQKLARRQQRIEQRLQPRTWPAQATPMYTASNIQYEHSDRVRGLASGGIGAMHRLARHTGFVEAIDRHVEVLKVHLPYHESDHVPNRDQRDAPARVARALMMGSLGCRW